MAGAWSLSGQEFQTGPTFEPFLAAELPSRTITCLAGDPLGSIWVGTPSGLARVLGDQVRIWRQQPGDVGSLPSNLVLSVDAGDPRRIWVGTSRGLCAIDPRSGRVRRFPCRLAGLDLTRANTVRQVIRTDERNLWAATAEDLLHFDMIEERWSVPGFHRRETPDLRFPAVPGAMAFDPKRRSLWLGTKEGLYRIDSSLIAAPHRAVLLDPFGVNTIIMCLALDDAGGVWMYDPEHASLTTIDPITGEFTRSPLPGRPDPWSICKAMLVEPSGAVWLGVNDGRSYRRGPGSLYWLDLNSDAGSPWQLPASVVADLHRDPTGTVWLATQAGLFRSVPEQEGQHVLAQWTRPVIVNQMRSWNGALHLATQGLGMVRIELDRPFESDTLLYSSTADDPVQDAWGQLANIVHDVLPQADGGGLVGTNIGSMRWEAGEAGYAIDRTRVPGSHTLDRRNVRTLQPGANGAVWLLALHHGLWSLPARGGIPFEVIGSEVGMSPAWGEPTAVLADAAGGAWCGTSTGWLIHVSPEGAIDLEKALRDSSALAGIDALAMSMDGRLLTGFDDGTISTFEPRTMRTSDAGKSLGDRIIAFERSASILWVLCDGGLWRVDLSEIDVPRRLSFAPHRGRPTAIASDEDGGVFVAFNTAILHVSNNAARDQLPATRTVIAGVVRAGRHLPMDLMHDSIRVAYAQRALRVQIAALGTPRPELVRFGYRLDRAMAWIDLGGSRWLDLPDLQEGSYRIEIAALDVAGGGPSASAVLDLTIAPPWYRSTWMLLASGCLLIAAAVLAVRLLVRRRLRAERARAERERALLEERMRIAHDLHDDLGSSLALIAMEGELARMGDGTDTFDALKRVSEGAREVTDNMRRIVWALGSGQDTLGDLVAYVRSSAAEMLERAEVALETEARIAAPGAKLTADQRRHLLLITKELLLNVVKHARASAVSLRILQENGTLMIHVSDNGRGFDAAARMGAGTGTTSLSERVKALHGSVDVRSSVDGGTTVEVNVPLGVEAV